MQIGHHSMVFFYNAEKKTFKFDAAYSPTGKGGSWSAVACSGFGVPVKAKNPEEGWQLVKYLTSEEKQCEIVSAKRWGSATVACEKNLLPNDNNPPSFKKVLVDPMYKAQGQATEIKTEAKGMIFPPFHNDIKQIFVTEFDAVSNCGGVKASDAVKKMQPQIQALLDHRYGRSTSTRVRLTSMPSAGPRSGRATTRRRPRRAVTMTASARPGTTYHARSPGRRPRLSLTPIAPLTGRQRSRSGGRHARSPTAVAASTPCAGRGSGSARASEAHRTSQAINMSSHRR
jgi:hypothetical protein